MLRATVLITTLFLATAAPAAEQVVLGAIGASAENWGSGWVVSSSSGSFGVGVARFPSVERRGLLEYALDSIPTDATILSASIGLEVYMFTTPPQSDVQFNGYMGDGMLMPADVVVPFNEIGRTGPIADLGIYTVNLDTAYIEAVLANGDGWLGVMTYQLTYEGSMAYSVGYGQPQLTIEYVPEPAALAVGLAATLLLRRR